MRCVRVVFAFAMLIAVPLLQSEPSPSPSASVPAVKNLSQLPLFFEPNRGQTDAQARFVARGQGYALFLTPDEAVLSLRSIKKDEKNLAADVLRLRLLGASAPPKITGREPLPGYSNYFIGQDQSKWRTRIPHYAKVQYNQVYPGVDLVYYGKQRQFEYDFVVAPGADPQAIAFHMAGSDKLELNDDGALLVHLSGGTLEMPKPLVYQQVNGERREIAGRYRLAADGRVSFAVGAYDTRQPLVIDPSLIYSTYLGGTSADNAYAIAVDTTGSAYVAGQTTSIDFPTLGAIQPTNNGINAFLTKFSADGASLVFSTYLGGTDIFCGGDRANAVALNSTNQPFIAGRAFSADFPVSSKAYQKTGGGCSGGGGGGSGFVTRFKADGTGIIYSTYFGGLVGNLPTNILSIAVSQTSNNAFITGYDQTGALATTGAFQTTLDATGDQGAFVTKFSVDGSALLYSTYVRATSTGTTVGNSIALDRNGNAYITGAAETSSFPVTAGGFQKVFGGGISDAFVTKVNSIGTKLVYSSYLGGSDPIQLEYGSQISVETTFGAYIVGTTGSTNFPTTLGTLQPTYPGGATNAFVVRVASDGSRLNFSTFLGGSQGSVGEGIGFNPGCRAPCNLLIYGSTTSTDFPLVTPMQTTGDLFLTMIDGLGASIPGYSTLMGSASGDTPFGLAVDSKLNAFVTGSTTSSSFPTTVGAFQPAFEGGISDGFAAKVGISADLALTQTASPNPVPTGTNLTYTITVTNNGPDAGVGLALSDTVPQGTTFVSITSTAGTCIPPPGQTGVARCMVNTLAPLGTWVTTFVVNVNALSGQIIHNHPAVTELVPDPDSTNNANTINVRVQ